MNKKIVFLLSLPYKVLFVRQIELWISRRRKKNHWHQSNTHNKIIISAHTTIQSFQRHICYTCIRKRCVIVVWYESQWSVSNNLWMTVNKNYTLTHTQIWTEFEYRKNSESIQNKSIFSELWEKFEGKQINFVVAYNSSKSNNDNGRWCTSVNACSTNFVASNTVTSKKFVHRSKIPPFLRLSHETYRVFWKIEKKHDLYHWLLFTIRSKFL